MIIPELILQQILSDMITELKSSVAASVTDNLIIKMFTGVPIVGKLDYSKEALNFIKDLNTDTRRITIKSGYSLTTEELPRINLVLPEENFGRQPLGLQEDPTIISGDKSYENASEANEVRYTLMIMADNADLVIVLYHIFKYMFLRYRDIIELYNFDNIKITGNDLQMDQQQTPKTLFVRALNISFQYEMTVERLNQPVLGSSILVNDSSLLIE